MSQNRSWRLRFTLGQVLALTLGVALGFAPLRLWELVKAPSSELFLHLSVVELPVAESRRIAPQITTGSVSIGLADRKMLEQLQALCQNGTARRLSEPILMTHSGRPTSFNVGGSIPTPVVKGEFLTIEYKDVGTRCDFLPTLQRSGRIRVETTATLTAVVPPPDADGPAALATRSGQTELDVSLGQSIIVRATGFKSESGRDGEQVETLIVARVEPGARQ